MKSQNQSENNINSKVASILETAQERPAPSQEISLENVRDLNKALEKEKSKGLNPVISEIKPTSPTTEGVENVDPESLAKEMENAGAAAISVLTEQEHFGGSPQNLEKARAAVDIPVLRKDFVLNEEELDRVEADIVLLIVRFLDNLDQMIEAARDRGFQVLVEVHTEEELEEAVQAGAKIIGVNNRNLSELEVDLNTFSNLSDKVPEDVTLIAESGIKTEKDAKEMMSQGADGMLIGTAIMDGKVEENIRKFTEAA